jgi:hypothetical protein
MIIMMIMFTYADFSGVLCKQVLIKPISSLDIIFDDNVVQLNSILK